MLYVQHHARAADVGHLVEPAQLRTAQPGAYSMRFLHLYRNLMYRKS